MSKRHHLQSAICNHGCVRRIPLQSAILLALLASVGSVCAAPVTKQAGNTTVLENAALRVEINAAAGRYQVLEKRSGTLWRAPEGEGSKAAQVVLPRLAAPPKVDGSLAEWSAVGSAVAIGEKEGVGARFRAAWDPAGLYLAVSVKDPKLVCPAADDAQWWERDSVEFWINETQVAVRFGAWGTNVWSSAGDVAGASAAFDETADGYAVEVMMPARLFGSPKAPGGQLRLAVGVNSADDASGRKTQLYYPATWQHSNSGTFAVALLADENGVVPTGKADPGPKLAPAPGKGAPGTASFRGSLRTAGKEQPVTYTFALDGDKPDLLLTVTADDPAAAADKFRVLHPLALDRPGEILAAPYMGGLGVPTDDLSWRGREWTTSGSLDMPWVGLTDGKAGYLLLWELPISVDNGIARLEDGIVAGRTVLAPAPWHMGIKGKFAAPRTIRYSFAAAGGHVALCKRYRAYALQHGFLKTLKEKAKRKPALARLAGAPDIWGRGDLKFCREAKAAGMDRMLVNAPQPKADTEAIKAMGYLTGRYDNYEDAFQGDKGAYGDFTTDTDSVIRADGQQMKAWLTHGNPPKQFMKRCTALFEKVARTWIPRDLEEHPMNARFLDVTTACSMIECYSERHPLTRTEDRAARRRLAKYVGDELGLVLGGEHGRWWGADIYDYWEGMQSGGFYSWPAGYVGEKLPQTREEIGQRYLEWGLGEKHRYPLWDLVFHDCVVSTWYWGDSTGHLIQTAPELGYKQDAFNILYGTIPLYWVNREFSYRWDKPETRARLLESYRNTCKLHEQIAFEEMTSHAFVTPDRAVQTTTFGDGTRVWVNFGKEPWTLKLAGKEYVLPEYGFYAKGPKIEQYRVLKDGRIATTIRTPDTLYADGSVPGLVEVAAGAGITLRREGADRLRIVSGSGERLRLNWKALCPSASDAARGPSASNAHRPAAASDAARGPSASDARRPAAASDAARGPSAGAGAWRVADLDDQGNAVRIGDLLQPKGEMLELSPVRPALLLGPKALAGVSEVVFAGAPGPVLSVKQGEPILLRLKLANYGGKSATRVPVVAFLGEDRLASVTVDVPAGGSAEAAFRIPSARYDGMLRLRFQAGDGKTVTFSKAGNLTERLVCVAPDWAQWDGHLDVTVEMGAAARRSPVVEMPFDLDAEWANLGKAGKADPGAVRVARLDVTDPRQALCDAQYAPGAPGESKLVWRIPGSFEAGASIRCRVYLAGAERKRHQAPPMRGWRAETQSYDGPRYTVRFVEGYIRGVSLKNPSVEILSHLGVSSADTGWVDEVGEVQSFEVLQDGPVMTRIRVKKKLQGNHSYDKLYTFYPDHFTVTTLSPERFGILSRAYYAAKCRYQDDLGNQADIDGKGDAEGIAGKSPKWYATWAEGWGLSGAAVTPHESVSYWDGGHMAGLGFNTARKTPATVAYTLHGADEPDLKAPDFAALDFSRATTPVVVRR